MCIVRRAWANRSARLLLQGLTQQGVPALAEAVVSDADALAVMQDAIDQGNYAASKEWGSSTIASRYILRAYSARTDAMHSADQLIQRADLCCGSMTCIYKSNSAA